MMFLRMLPIAGFTLLPLCLSAGRWDNPWFYAYAGLLWFAAGLIYTIIPRELALERMKPPSDRDARTRRIALPVLFVHYVIAGLDLRWGAGVRPLVMHGLGLLLVAVAMGMVAWTLRANPFASSAVRMQAERGQRVISSGPYAFVRHPMYLGVFAFSLGSGLALGSWWSASLLLAGALPLFIRRTLLEDRMLHVELEGYREYASRVRWRVVPGIF